MNSLLLAMSRCLTAVIFVILIGAALSGRADAVESPNIIFIFTDDMGYGDVSCNGGRYATPNIDRLASQGLRFTQFYVASPICSPSRAGLLTGMYPARWKIKTFLNTRAGNRAAGQVDFLNPQAPSLPRTLQEAGYATAHIGKWHLGGGRDVTNAPAFAEYGYDEHISTYESPDPDPNLTATDWIWSTEDTVKRWDRSRYFVDKTLDFLRRNKGKPCFVNFWPDDVHTPWVPESTVAPKRGRHEHESEEEFKQVLAEYDKQIGRLLDGLKLMGLEQNTIVMFSSDNGPGPDFPGNPRSIGMRGQKGSLYEGGIRMPFIVRWPGKVPANKVNTATILGAVDIFPTVCRIAEVPLPATATFDGEDMSQAFFGKPINRAKPLLWQFVRDTNGRTRMNKDLSPGLAVREGKWKLLVHPDGRGIELYDLENDRNETRNLAKLNVETARRMSESVLKWARQLP